MTTKTERLKLKEYLDASEARTRGREQISVISTEIIPEECRWRGAPFSPSPAQVFEPSQVLDILDDLIALVGRERIRELIAEEER